MRSWDNAKGGEGGIPLSLPKRKKACPHRVWFGDYSLNYCDIDKEECDYKTECRHTKNGLCNITIKSKG